MKKIKIIFNDQIETLFDEDESNLEEYSKAISSLFISGNVNIIQTTNEYLLVRPSKVLAIKVTEEAKHEEKKIEELEDTVTDQ
jgi:predicted P-loop ATPase/GTPase